MERLVKKNDKKSSVGKTNAVKTSIQMAKGTPVKGISNQKMSGYVQHIGNQMPETALQKMGEYFNKDFSNVKIHPSSDKPAQVGALAYTKGNNIYFSPGQYSPHTHRGQALLGHELTHVLQQSQGRVQATRYHKGNAINDDPTLEHEADVMGMKVSSLGYKSNDKKKSSYPSIQLYSGSHRGMIQCARQIAQGIIKKKISKRLLYVGRTPSKTSKTGREVIKRMIGENKIRVVRGKMEFKASDNHYYAIKYADMSHRHDAVTWWNKTGRKFGARAPEVRRWMLDSRNYYLDHFSINRSQGAKLKENYKMPLK